MLSRNDTQVRLLGREVTDGYSLFPNNQDGFTRPNYMKYERANHQFCCKAMHKMMYCSMWRCGAINSVNVSSVKCVSSYYWCGACLGESKSNAVNLILRLFLYNFLHTMSSWRHKSIHNNTNNQQTPPPWWWSCSPLQRRGLDESTMSEWRAALLMFVPRLLSKGFGRINKLK